MKIIHTSLIILVLSSGCDSESVSMDTESGSPDPLTVPAGDVVKINPEGKSFADPEFLNYGFAKVAFQDHINRIWIGNLDPVTGRFLSETGEDILVDTDGASLAETNNGPEFGLNSNEWSVFYAKITDNVIQLWRAWIDNSGEVHQKQLTSGGAHMTPIAQQSQSVNFNRVLYINGTWDMGYIAWLRDDPLSVDNDFIPVENKDATHPTWVEGTGYIIYREQSTQSYGQLALYNTLTGEKNVITDDVGGKFFPFAWRAPEYNNELVAMALVDSTKDGIITKTSIALYKDNGGAYWDRILTLQIPEESGGVTLGSAEPFIAQGRSYLSLSIQLNDSVVPGIADAQVWIFGIEENPDDRTRFRCDDGMPSPQMRIDPETLLGSEQVFVYYNTLTQNGFDIYRCATGIRTK